MYTLDINPFAELSIFHELTLPLYIYCSEVSNNSHELTNLQTTVLIKQLD